MIGRMMPSLERHSCSSPQNLKISYVMWQGGIKVADIIKFASQLKL